MSIEKFLMKKGLAKSKGQAQGIMIIVIILCLLFIVFNSRDSRPAPAGDVPIDALQEGIPGEGIPGEEFPA